MRLAKQRYPRWEGAAQPGGVVAAPVQDHVAVGDPVAGFELDRDAARHRRPGVEAPLRVLRPGVAAPVAARHHPQHVVVVEGDVPLQEGRPVGEHVLLQAAQRRQAGRGDVAVPAGASHPDRGAAEHGEHPRAGDRRPHEPPADAHGGLPEAEVDDVGRRHVDDLVDGDAGLLCQLPLPARRVSRLALLPPDLLLALQQPLAAIAHARKLAAGDDSAEDDESLLEQFLRIGVHPAAFTRRGCGRGRVPGFQ